MTNSVGRIPSVPVGKGDRIKNLSDGLRPWYTLSREIYTARRRGEFGQRVRHAHRSGRGPTAHRACTDDADSGDTGETRYTDDPWCADASNRVDDGCTRGEIGRAHV